jgi:NAD(P)H-quinone oxidoreductase subunit 5
MHHPLSPVLSVLLLILSPLLVLFPGFFPGSFLQKRAYYYAFLAEILALTGFLLAIISTGFLMAFGPMTRSFLLLGFFSPGLYFDTLSSIALLLISFLLWMVLRFSKTYLKSDPGQGRFTKWICLTGGSVLFLVISGNLIQFTLAWVSTSLCLHQLLQFYPDRPGALLAARKKFILSRLGEACLLVVLIGVYKDFHTENFAEIFAQVHKHYSSPEKFPIPNLHLISLFIVIGAMLKSAQFPFHSWLPDTMETPTPVSALMHAGIINAGGFLIIRMSPLVGLSHNAMEILALFGAITALLGSLVMLTHSSIKRVLAFSTLSQMGFMMLECGLGAFSLALLHLVTHSLYKAYAFLSSGTLKNTGKSFLSPGNERNYNPWILILSLMISFITALGFSLLFQIKGFGDPKSLVLETLFILSLGYFLWNLWSQKWDIRYTLYGIVLSLGLGFSYFFLDKIFGALLPSSIPDKVYVYTLFEYFLLGFLVFLFVMVMVLQMEIPKRMYTSFMKEIYVHARNGFYFNTLFNQWVQKLWPVQKPISK